MDRPSPASRRRQRSLRITVSFLLLALATAAVAAALGSGDARALTGAAVVAVVAGWVAFRLVWQTMLRERYEHGAERNELARSYRALFTERSLEQRSFVDLMNARLTDRERTIDELGHALADSQTRAAVAEHSVHRFQRRLTEAEGRIVSLEEYLARSQDECRRATAMLVSVRAELDAKADPPAARPTVVPEWAHLETDPTAALMAWEEHAQHHAERGRHAGGEDRVAGQA